MSTQALALRPVRVKRAPLRFGDSICHPECVGDKHHEDCLEDTDHRVDAAREPEIDAEPTLKRIKIVLKVIDPIKRREGLKSACDGLPEDLTIRINGSKEYKVNRGILSYYSPVIAEHCRTDRTKNKSKIIRLEETSFEAMELLKRWIDTATVKDSEKHYDYPSAVYFILAILANKLFISELQNEALEAGYHVSMNMNSFDADLPYLYEHTLDGSIIRKLVVNMFVLSTDHGHLVEAVKLSGHQYPFEFLSELYAARMVAKKRGIDKDFAVSVLNLDYYFVNRILKGEYNKELARW